MQNQLNFLFKSIMRIADRQKRGIFTFFFYQFPFTKSLGSSESQKTHFVISFIKNSFITLLENSWKWKQRFYWVTYCSILMRIPVRKNRFLLNSWLPFSQSWKPRLKYCFLMSKKENSCLHNHGCLQELCAPSVDRSMLYILEIQTTGSRWYICSARYGFAIPVSMCFMSEL